eukprot:scaffold283991_cov31-Tisochrysis_lutea.AAC.3
MAGDDGKAVRARHEYGTLNTACGTTNRGKWRAIQACGKRLSPSSPRLRVDLQLEQQLNSSPIPRP